MTTTLAIILSQAEAALAERRRQFAADVAEQERREASAGRQVLIDALPELLPFLAPYFDPTLVPPGQNEIDLGGIVVRGSAHYANGGPVLIDRLRCPACGQWVGAGQRLPADGATLEWFAEMARSIFEYHDDEPCHGAPTAPFDLTMIGG